MNTNMSNRFNTLSEEEWYEIAPQAGGVGRWMWNLTQNECSLDNMAKSITGLWEKPDVFPANDYLETIHPEDRDRVWDLIKSSREQRTLYEAQYRIRNAKGQIVWVDGRGKFVRTETGDDILIGVLLDVSDLMAARERNELLAHEMSHRVKNNFSLISGIFRMAVRSASDMKELEKAFIGRIQALGVLNDLTLRSATRSVTVKEISSKFFASLEGDDRVEKDIDDFVLNGAAAQTLCLTLNELLTNAVKYGALSEKTGRLKISINVNEAEDKFVLSWSETVKQKITPPTKKSGFGLRVLMKMTRSTFKGQPNLEWDSKGMSFECIWTASDMGV